MFVENHCYNAVNKSENQAILLIILMATYPLVELNEVLLLFTSFEMHIVFV